MHAQNSIDALDRIFRVFPEKELRRVRMQLADTLLLVFSQKLIPMKHDKGRVLAFGKLSHSDRVAHILKEGSMANLQTLAQMGAEDFIPLEQKIAGLCLSDTISFEDASAAVDNHSYFKELMKGGKI
jgi:twitching motility protein PilT